MNPDGDVYCIIKPWITGTHKKQQPTENEKNCKYRNTVEFAYNDSFSCPLKWRYKAILLYKLNGGFVFTFGFSGEGSYPCPRQLRH